MITVSKSVQSKIRQHLKIVDITYEQTLLRNSVNFCTLQKWTSVWREILVLDRSIIKVNCKIKLKRMICIV